MKIRSTLLSTLVLFTAFISQVSHAGSILYISDGNAANDVLLTDADIDGDGETTIAHFGSIGSWGLVFSIATGNNGSAVGSGTPSMELSAAAVGEGMLDIWFIQDGFTTTPASIKSSLGSTLDATAEDGSFITQQTCVLEGNTNFDCDPFSNPGAMPLSELEVNAPDTVASLIDSTPFDGLSGYAIATHVVFNHMSVLHSSVDSNIQVPAPATIPLIALGLIGLGIARRRSTAAQH